MAAAVSGGQLVTVTYTAPTDNAANSNSAIQDTAGNDAVALSNESVINNSTQGRPVINQVIIGASGTEAHFCYNKSADTPVY
jgi:hypothetical protein